MKKVSLLFVFLLLLVGLAGCSGADHLAVENAEMLYATQTSQDSASLNEWNHTEELAGGVRPTLLATDDRKLILSADARLETKDFDSSRSGIEAALTAAGGYTQDSDLIGDGSADNLRSYHAVLRIPQDKFEAFVEGLDAHGNLLSLSKTGNDVSEFYFDNEARIKILEVEEAELLDLMARADKVSDIFSIRDRISEIRTEIERLKGQNIKTDNLVAMSTVTLTLIEVESIAPANEGFLARAGYTFTRSLDAFVSFSQGLAIVLIAIAPFALSLLVIAIAVRMIVKRCKKQKADPS